MAGEPVTVEPDQEAEELGGGSLVEMFHLVNSLLPDEQSVVSVRPGTQLRQALEVMRKHGFSQLPVVEGDQVLGVFSYRSFAMRAAELGTIDLERVEVDDCLEDFEFVRVSSEAPPQTIEVGGSAGVIVRAGSSS